MEGIERLKKLIEGQKDKALNKVVDYLITREDMNKKYLNEEKDLKGMIDYIRGEAEKQAKNGIAMIEDEIVYGWAIHYFDETNEVLGITKSVSKTTLDKSKEDDEDEDRVSLPKQVIKQNKKEKANADQLTLF
jgi:hypothetical protein